MSLVTRLLLLLVLGTVPILGAQVVTQLELWHERAAAERANAGRYARLVAEDTARIIEGAKGILIAVSETPIIRRVDRPQCLVYLADLAKRYQQILNITLIDGAGQPICANSPIVPNATAIGRFYFDEALRTGDFVIGTYIIGRSVPLPQLPVALPLKDEAGDRLVLSIGFNLDWLRRHFSELPLPSRASILIADRQGTVVVAPNAPQLVGQPLPPKFQPALGPEEGSFDRRDADGVSHVVSFQPVQADPAGLIVVVDFSREETLSAARANTERDAAIVLVSILTTVFLVTVGARYLVVRPIRTLTDAAILWSAGRYSIRANLHDRTSEVGQLGVAFDGMADVIENNQRALQSMNETLERRVIERTEELSESNRQLETEMAQRQAAEASLRQAQKMEALGRLTGGIAHDFNNLLTAIGGSLDFLAKAIPNHTERTLRFAAMGREGVERAARMVHRLLAFARQQPLEMHVVDLNRLVAGRANFSGAPLAKPSMCKQHWREACG